MGLTRRYCDASAAVNIDRKIGKTDAQMPEIKEEPQEVKPCEPPQPLPYPIPRRIRNSGTGCVYQISDNLWEGSFYPRLPDGKRKKFNVYAETREEAEIKLAEMIAEKKAEIKAEKEKENRWRVHEKRADRIKRSARKSKGKII